MIFLIVRVWIAVADSLSIVLISDRIQKPVQSSQAKPDFIKQHFSIETRRAGRLVEIIENEDLDIGFWNPSCSTFEIGQSTIAIIVIFRIK